MPMARNSSSVPTEQRILLAADACVRRQGAAATTVEQVVIEAGVSRSTFYRHFPDLDTVIIHIAVEDGRRQLQRAVEQVADETTFADKLRGVLMFMITRGLERPNIKGLMTGPGALETVNTVLNDPDALYEIGATLHPLFTWAAARDELRPDLSHEQAAEWLLRNVWSLTVAPPRGGWTDDRLRQYLDDFVLPAVLAASALGRPRLVRSLVDDARRALDRIDHHLDQAARP